MTTIEKATCKTCGFYENNCPFIRGKFIPYPNKVCKDYTFSTLKAEQEPVSEDLEEAANKFAVFYDQGTCDGIAQECFKAGAEWQYQKDRAEFAKLKAKEWSEEDEKYLSQAIETLEHENYLILADKLKSLRPSPSWRPRTLRQRRDGMKSR